MFRLHLGDYNSHFASLRNFMVRVERAQWTYKDGEYVCLTKEQATELSTLITLFEDVCIKVEFARPLERVPKVRLIVENPSKYDLATVKWELKELLEAAVTETHEKKFFGVPEDVAKYYNLKHPFGEAVYEAFKSARHDAREAKNCYVLDRHTACVFHCMRVLEKGLHALVHHLNNAHSAGIVFSKTVEETNWGNIIDEIQIALENPKRTRRLNPLPSQDEMRFYSKLSLEFDYFNEAWRKDVSHSRSSYDETSAKSVMEHVERFMRQLVEGLLVRAKISVDSAVMDQALEHLEIAVKERGYILKPFLQSAQVLAQLVSIPSSSSSAGLACDYRIGFKLSDLLLIYIPAPGTGDRNSGTPIN